MTILKTYVVQLSNHDGCIDHANIKARSLKEATMKAEDRYVKVAGVYVGTPCRLLEMKQFIHSRREGDLFTGRRYNSLGEFIFQHKGRKRKGTKNYPTPKNGWVKGPTLFLTWNEKHDPAVSDFITRWVTDLVGDETT